MPTERLSKEDVEALADKLSALDAQLSDQERALLSGILHVTADAASPAGGGSPLIRRVEQPSGPPVEVDVEGALPSLRNEFVKAFTPGQVSDAGGAAAAGEVTGTVGIAIRF